MYKLQDGCRLLISTNHRKASLQDFIERTKEIKERLLDNLANLQKNLEMLEGQPNLLFKIESDKKDAETRANELENEVKCLREELNSLKALLGLEAKKI